MQRAQPDDKARHAGLRPNHLIHGTENGSSGSPFVHQSVAHPEQGGPVLEQIGCPGLCRSPERRLTMIETKTGNIRSGNPLLERSRLAVMAAPFWRANDIAGCVLAQALGH